MANFDLSTSLKGVGVDCTRISRFAEFNDVIRERLAQEILSEDEYREYEKSKNRPKRLACFFCYKEAVAKALGTGFSEFGFPDIVIKKDEKNRPFVLLKDKAARVAKKKGISAVKVSLTHEGDLIIAFAISV